MMPLKPRDNALFVRNFRERMRTHVIGSYAAILFVLVMIFLLALTEIFAKTGRENALFPFIPHCVPAEALAVIAIFQGGVLLLLGTLSAYRMALQDRLNGTLDFFRATPTEGFNHVIGLVFGATITEWFFFLLLVPVMFALALLSDIKFAALMNFHISLIICAVFYHSLGVLAGVCATMKKYRAAMKIVLLAALICGGTAALIYIKSSVAYHSTFLPCYINLLAGSLDRGTFSGSDFLHYNLYIFFGKPLPSLLFQALVQAPLCVLVWLAIKRKISSAETPVLSKLQLVILISAFLFYFTGDSLTIAGFRSINDVPKGFNPILFSYFFLFFFLSVFFSIITAPTALAYRKGFNRAIKSGLPKPGWFDEQNSNAGWITLLCVLFAAVYFALCARFKVSSPVLAASSAMLMVYIIFFAGAFEFFRLSRFRGKTIIFSTAVLIVWIALPVSEAILYDYNYPLKYPFFIWFSPLAGLLIWGGHAPTINSAKLTLDQFLLKLTDSHPAFPDLSVFLIILGHLYLLALTVLFIMLAAREQKRIRTSVTGSRGPTDRNDRPAQPAQPGDSI